MASMSKWTLADIHILSMTGELYRIIYAKDCVFSLQLYLFPWMIHLLFLFTWILMEFWYQRCVTSVLSVRGVYLVCPCPLFLYITLSKHHCSFEINALVLPFVREDFLFSHCTAYPVINTGMHTSTKNTDIGDWLIIINNLFCGIFFLLKLWCSSSHDHCMSRIFHVFDTSWELQDT